jgi:hypothetical protein
VEQTWFEEDDRGLWPRWFYSKLNRNKPNKTDWKIYLHENLFHQHGSNSHPEGMRRCSRLHLFSETKLANHIFNEVKDV